eukprot:jgi/Tetstr1/440147/TSEL_028504.t1
MVPWTIGEIGARLTGSSVFFRLDNTSSNTLADSLSRLRGAIRDQGRCLLGDIFRALEAACSPFDVDACSE